LRGWKRHAVETSVILFLLGTLLMIGFSLVNALRP